MNVLQNSLTGRLLLPVWVLILRYYESSGLSCLIRRIADWIQAGCAGSSIVKFLTREGVLSRGFRKSWFCKIATFLLNLPGLLLHWVYRKLRPVFESSIAARIGFGLVEETPAAAGWMLLLFLVIPYERWNNAYSFVGFTLLLLFAVAARMRNNRRRLEVVGIGPYVIAFGGLVMAAFLLSVYRPLSVRFLLYHLSCMLCVLVIVSTVERADQLMRLAGSATTGLVIVSVYAIIQRIQGVEVNPSFVDLTLNKNMPGRVFSVFENPNAFGEVLVLLIPLAVAVMLGSRGWLGRLWGLLGAGLGAVSLVMTYSRAGWIGLAVAAFLFLLLWKPKLLPIAILVGIAVLPFLPHAVFHRILTIFNLSDTSTSSRFPLYQAALRLLHLRPFQGVGLGSAAVRQAVTDLNLYHGVAPFVHCHNVYLQVWTETGLLGLFAFLGSVGWTLKKAAKAVRGKIGSTSLLIIGGISAVIGTLVCGIADYVWHYPRVMLIFWFLFAFTLAGIRLAAREKKAFS